jgi:hypothetical protein
MQGSSFALRLTTATAITNPSAAGDTALAAFGLNLFEPDLCQVCWMPPRATMPT